MPIEAIHDADGGIPAVLAAVARMDARLGREHAENQDATAEFKRDVNERLTELQKAFPGGDAEGHRRLHEALIEQAAERAKFWRDMRGKLMERGIWAVVLFLCGLLGLWLKGQVR